MKHLITLLLLVSFINLHAKDIYVANNGNDNNNGSINAPLKTIEKASKIANPGDIVYIRAGIYKDKNINIRTSGLPGKYITYTTLPNEKHKAIIDSRTFRILQASYIKVSNIRVQNTKDFKNAVGIYIEGPGTNVTVEDCYTYNTFGSGIAAWGVRFGNSDPRNFRNLFNIKINNNKVEKACNKGYNECITLAKGVVNFEVTNNEVFNGGNPINGGEGIDIKGGCDNGIVAFNKTHGLTRRGIYLDGIGSIQNGNKPAVKNVEVYGNVSYDNDGHGIAIMTEGQGDVHGIKVYNNLLYNNKEDDGIMIFKHPAGSGNIYDVDIYNNTIVGNKRHGVLVSFPGAYDIRVYNNILYKNGGQNYRNTGGDATEFNNLIGINPNFVNESASNYRLKSQSPAINAGTATDAANVDITGATRTGNPDIGAYEANISTSCSASGTILMERYDGIRGRSINNLINASNYPDNPSSSSELTSFEISTNVANNYGVRVRGKLCAPETGTYYFWIAGDDNVQLHLSTNTTEENKQQIAYHNTWTSSRQWNKFATQKSSGIRLIAGQSYYIEALMKEGSGGDNLAVGWRKPSDRNGTSPKEIIPGNVLSSVSNTKKVSGLKIVRDDAKAEFLIYPNPIGNTLNIELGANQNVNAIYLIGVDGKTIFKKSISNNKTEKLTINLNKYRLEAGIYFMKFISSDSVKTMKLIKR